MVVPLQRLGMLYGSFVEGRLRPSERAVLSGLAGCTGLFGSRRDDSVGGIRDVLGALAGLACCVWVARHPSGGWRRLVP